MMTLRVFGEHRGSPRQSLGRKTAFPSDQLGRLNDKEREVFAALSPSLITSVHATDTGRLIDLASRVVNNPEILGRVMFTIGYGVGVGKEVALRLPAYILPVIQIYQALEKLSLPLPITRLYSAHTMKILMGGDEHVVWLAGVRNLAITAAFIGRFFPRYADNFLYDFLLPVDSKIETRLRQLAARLEELRSEDPVLNEAAKYLEAMASRNGGTEVSPLVYAAAHTTANFDLEGEVTLSRMGLPSDTDTVVTVGGWPERVFNAMRAACREDQTHSSRGAISLLTSIGEVPVYSCLEGEPTFNSVGNLSADALEQLTNTDAFLVLNPTGSKPYQRDLAALFAAVEPQEYFRWAVQVQAAFQAVTKAFQTDFPVGNSMDPAWVRREAMGWLEHFCWLLLKTRGDLQKALSLTTSGNLEERRPKREIVGIFRAETNPL